MKSTPLLKFSSLTVVCVVFFFNSSYSQDTNEEKDLVQLAKEIDGTYQMQMVNSRALPTIHLKELEVIESMRHETDTIYHYFTENKRVMILPKSVILDPNFTKIPTINR